MTDTILRAVLSGVKTPSRGRACLLDMGQLASPGENREPPTELLLFPRGKVRTTKGTFLLDEKALQSVMEEWADYTGGIDHKGVFDYNHDMAKQGVPGHELIAAGWFDMEPRDEGLMATDIRWCERAAAMIRAAEMRFWSPWFEYEAKTGRILKILNCAITCMPATKSQKPMVAATLTAGRVLSLPPPLDDAPVVRAAQLAALSEDEGVLPPVPAPAPPPAGPAVPWTHHVITTARAAYLARQERISMSMNYGALYTLKMLIGIGADEMSLCLSLQEYMEDRGTKEAIPVLAGYCSTASKRIASYAAWLASLAGDEMAEPSEEETTSICTRVVGLSKVSDETERKGYARSLCLATKLGWSAVSAMEQLSSITKQTRWDLVLSALPTLKEEVVNARELAGFAPILSTVKEITGCQDVGGMKGALLALHSNSERDAEVLTTARTITGKVEAKDVVAELQTLATAKAEVAQRDLAALVAEGLGKAPGPDGKVTIKLSEAQVPLFKKLSVQDGRAWLDSSPVLKIGTDYEQLPPVTKIPTTDTGGGAANPPGSGETTLSLPAGTVLPDGVTAEDVLGNARAFNLAPEKILAQLAK